MYRLRVSMLSPLDNECHEQSGKNGYAMPVESIRLEHEPCNRVARHQHKGSWACNPNTRKREKLSKAMASHASRTTTLPQSSIALQSWWFSYVPERNGVSRLCWV